MRRREFITLLGGAAAWPTMARAQQGERMRRIGMLMSLAEDDPEDRPRRAAFQQALRELGWSEGGNLRIDYRWFGGDPVRARAMAKELVDLQPDLIVATATSGLAALALQMRAIPIVFVAVSDPVGQGFVASLARPGGNATGLTFFEFSVAGEGQRRGVFVVVRSAVRSESAPASRKMALGCEKRRDSRPRGQTARLRRFGRRT